MNLVSEEQTTGKVLVYVRKVGRRADGKYEYDFLFSESPEYVWGIDWDNDNPASCGDISPDDTTYSEVYTVVTDLPLKTAQETMCYSMEYATYGVLALAWIDIENLEAYPEHGRMTLKFGMNKDEVFGKLEPYGYNMEVKQLKNN